MALDLLGSSRMMTRKAFPEIEDYGAFAREKEERGR